MAYITAERKAALEADLAAKNLQIAAMDAALATDPFATGTKRYDNDAGFGRQTQVFNSPLELIKARETLERARDKIMLILNGQSVMTQQSRR
jgi:hypothetical protein